MNTREQWLKDFIALSLPLIRSRTGLSPTKPVEISVGFPTNGGKRSKSGTVTSGQCLLHPNRKHHHIFIHPFQTDPKMVGETVLHELLHASLDAGVGHRRPFSQAAKALGLVGKPTSTELSPELEKRVEEIVTQIGYDYPHPESVEVSAKPQATRLLKVMCPVCGYVARVTAKWIEEAGTPICPQDLIAFTEAGVDDEASMPLTVVHQVVEYAVPTPKEKIREAKKAGIKLPTFDPRFFIQMKRDGSDIEWSVIDHGPAVINGMAVLGVKHPKLYHADTKQDAIDLIDGLRDGTLDPKDARDTTQVDVEAIDNDPDLDADWPEGDPRWAEEEPDEEDVFDFADDDADPRFQWEKDRDIPVESINPDHEADKREGWVNR